MSFYEYLETMGGIPIRQYPLDSPPGSLRGAGWRITIDWDGYENGVKLTDKLAELTAQDGAAELEALVIGAWDGAMEGEASEGLIEALVAARAELPGLRRLFLGDILQEESEASWIQQTDISPLFLAYPELVELRVRGSSGLSLGRPEHAKLQRLVIECGGLPGSVAREVSSAKLPGLTHLELWLGDEGYGRDLTEGDLAPVLSGEAFPELSYLGLRNDREADAMAAWLDDAAVLEDLDTLDLSLGCLGDEGAARLLANPRIRGLKRLDLHHHFLSQPMAERLASELEGVELDVSDPQDEDRYGDETYRYNFVSE